MSRFSPWPDGIAKYADQYASRLAARSEVIKIGPPPSRADVIVRLDGGLRPLRLLIHTKRHDHITIMWHPWYYVSGRLWDRAGAYLSLGVVARRRRHTIVVHEPEYVREDSAQAKTVRRTAGYLERHAQKWLWRGVRSFVFHSEWQRRDFISRLPVSSLAASKAPLLTHSSVFLPYTGRNQRQARQSLGLATAVPVFVCIGFFGRHKGFDRAIHAFRTLPTGTGRLYVIGSQPYPWPDTAAHVSELSCLAEHDGIELIEQFVDDATFDTWVRAADAIVAPYRSASSSGVIARAQLLGTPVIATMVGGIGEQLTERDIPIATDEDLVSAMMTIVRRSGRAR